MTATAVSKSLTFYFAVLPTGSKPHDINKKHCNEISRYACNSSLNQFKSSAQGHKINTSRQSFIAVNCRTNCR